jgi:cytochrome c553
MRAGGSPARLLSKRVFVMVRSCWLSFLLLATTACFAQADATAGKTKARACAVCHGPLGVAAAPDTPHIAGQPERYLSEQLKAYRGGKRFHEVMSVMAKPLTDDDIRDLSAWFSSLTVEAKAPQ